MASQNTLSQNDTTADLVSDGFTIFKLLGYKESDFNTIFEYLQSHYDGKFTLKLPDGGAQHYGYSKANSGLDLRLTSFGVKPTEDGTELGSIDAT